jgi:streptomycin 6-kinase
MRTIRIPPQLADAVEEDDYPERLDWLAALPSVVDEIASDWQLELGDPYLPGGQCAWVAPARTGTDDKLVLKVGWRHREAEHEADALRLWDGDGAIRCLAARSLEDTTALLLERCAPGHRLSRLPEPEQDEIIAGLLRRLWDHAPPPGHPFASLEDMCGLRADWFELDPERVRHWLFARCVQESLHDVTMREAARRIA